MYREPCLSDGQKESIYIYLAILVQYCISSIVEDLSEFHIISIKQCKNKVHRYYNG